MPILIQNMRSAQVIDKLQFRATAFDSIGQKLLRLDSLRKSYCVRTHCENRYYAISINPWSVVFFHTRSDTTKNFLAEYGRFGRGLVVDSVVFWSYFGRWFSPFDQDFMV